MPSLAGTTFLIDPPTVCAVTVFVALIGGLLLILAWMQNRSEPALALWGLGYLLGSLGVVLMALGGPASPGWLICIGNALICSSYGTMWAGARSFEGRRIRIALVAAGTAVWILAWQFSGFSQSVRLHVVLLSGICAVYVLLGAREVWDGRDPDLISRWPTLAVVLIHAGFLLARIPYAASLPLTPIVIEAHRTAVVILAFEALFAAFSLAFLRVSMAKERAELQQRKAASTDALTGIANRRSFFDVGAPMLERAIADRRPAALLLFDLDRFKEVNDTNGHEAGDDVLIRFSRQLASRMRPGDVCARIGGEEFACLLVDTTMSAALQVAERIRNRFAATVFAGLTTSTTVSVGIAMAGESGRTLSALLGRADRALYRAKAEGRNRVAPEPLVLVEKNGGEATRLPALEGRTAAFAAPLAG